MQSLSFYNKQLALILAFLITMFVSAKQNCYTLRAQSKVSNQLMSAPADVAAAPPDTEKTSAGVAMKLLKSGHGKIHPEDNDCVKMHYTLWKRDGTLLSSSRVRNVIETQCIRSLFPGIREALKTMVAGEERRLWVPANLTYRADDDDAPTRIDLTAEIELIEIIKAPPTPKDLNAPPQTADKTPSGLAYQILEKGTGTQRPLSSSRVTLHLSGWTAQGNLFESTERGSHPATYLVSQLIPGLHEGLLEMVVGEKRRFWIPARLAYGEKRGRRGVPIGNLVYEVKLLAVEK